MPLLYWFSMQPEAAKYKSIRSKYKTILSVDKSIRSKYKAYFQSTKVYFQSTKCYFQSTKAYFQSTKVYFQKYKSILSRSTRIYFQSTKLYFPSTKVYFQSIYTSILSKYKSALPKHKVSLHGNGISGTRNLLNTSGFRNRFWRPNLANRFQPSEPIEHQNPRNLGHATFWTRKPGPVSRNWFPESEDLSPRTVPQPVLGTRFLPGTAPARPEHTEIYIVQRPQSILLLRKKIWNCTGKHLYARWIIRIFMPYLPLKVVWISKGCGIVLGILFFSGLFFFWLGVVLVLSRLLFGKTQGWKAGSCGFFRTLGVVLGLSRLRSGETSGEMQVPSRFGHKKLLQKANCPVHFCFLCVFIYVDVCVCVCDRVCSMCFLSVVVLIFHSMHFFSCICNLSI